MFYSYVLLSIKDGKFYSGYTENLRDRLSKHKKGEIVSTKHRLPVELIYFEACLNKDDALQREKYFKSGKGKKFLKVRLKRFLSTNI